MCYHCATNPSIHHRCRRVAAVSSPLSHHGVTFTVMLSRFDCCHCNVAFIIALLRCHCRSCVVAVPSLSHCRGFVVAVMVSLSSSHCRSFVVTVVVSPLHLSQFRHCCCGVTFASVMVSSSLLWCRLRVSRGFIVTVMVLPSLSHCHGFIIVMVLPSLLHCCGVIVTVSSLPLWC